MSAATLQRKASSSLAFCWFCSSWMSAHHSQMLSLRIHGYTSWVPPHRRHVADSLSLISAAMWSMLSGAGGATAQLDDDGAFICHAFGVLVADIVGEVVLPAYG